MKFFLRILDSRNDHVSFSVHGFSKNKLFTGKSIFSVSTINLPPINYNNGDKNFLYLSSSIDFRMGSFIYPFHSPVSMLESLNGSPCLFLVADVSKVYWDSYVTLLIMN